MLCCSIYYLFNFLRIQALSNPFKGLSHSDPPLGAFLLDIALVSTDQAINKVKNGLSKPRPGWIDRGIPQYQAETVLEHSIKVYRAARFVLENFKIFFEVGRDILSSPIELGFSFIFYTIQ